MNILCTICSDLVNQAENIYVTKCGHIFHHHCLAQWIERSKTCPQCRNKVTDKCMFRLYPTVSNENNSEDAATLQSRLDDAQLQLRQQRVKYKEKEDKLAVVTADLKRQDDLLKSYEKRLVSFDSKVLALREQLEFSNIQNKDMQRIKEENEALKKNMQTLNGLQKVLNATSDDVEHMLNSYTDVRTIATFATALKRALCDSEAKKNESRDRLHAAKQQLALEKKHSADLQNKVIHLEEELHQQQAKYDMLKTDLDLAALKREVSLHREEERRILNDHPTSPPTPERPRVYSDSDSFTENDRRANDCVDMKHLERKKNAAWRNVLCAPKAIRINQATNITEKEKQKGYQEMTRKIKAIIRMKNEDRKEREKELSDSIGRANAKLYWKQNEMVNNIENSDSPYLSLKQGNVLSLAALQRAPLKLPDKAKGHDVLPRRSRDPDSSLALKRQHQCAVCRSCGHVNVLGKKPTENLFLNAVKNANKPRIGEKSNDFSTKHSIFHKKEPMKIDSLNDNIPSDMDISYDGLGGHSKPDVFPVPSKAPVKSCIPKISAKHKLKRPNPTGSQDIEKLLKKVKNK